MHFHDNYFAHDRSIATYFHAAANGVTSFLLQDNVFREIDFQYDELDATATDHNAIFRIFNVENPIELRNNRWSGPQVFAQAAGSNVVQSGNTNTALPPIEGNAADPRQLHRLATSSVRRCG